MNTFILAVLAFTACVSFAKAAKTSLRNSEDDQKILGRYNMIQNINFDAYMKQVGVGYFLRQVANRLSPAIEINTDNDDTWHIKMISLFVTTEQIFKLGVPFDETTPDGRRCISTMTKGNNKLRQEQDCNGTKSTITREFTDEQMTVTLTSGGVVAVRTYKRS